LRRNLDGHTAGLSGQNVEILHINQPDKVLAFHRFDQGGPDDNVVVIVNLKNQPVNDYRIRLPRPGKWKTRFNSDSAVYDPTFSNLGVADISAGPDEGSDPSYVATIIMGPYALVILSQDA
jgi:1,4-alpha-glucan branching enzyme